MSRSTADGGAVPAARPVLFLASVLTISAASGAAGQARPVPPAPPWGIGFESLPHVVLPRDVRDMLAPDLEYEPGEPVEGVIIDLNRDGAADYLVQSSSRLCGTGGCGYRLVDGARMTVIGSFSGTPLYVQATRRHGYPTIQTYSHSSASSGTWTTYVYDGTRYRVSAQRTLRDGEVDSLFAVLRRVPLWRPSGS